MPLGRSLSPAPVSIPICHAARACRCCACLQSLAVQGYVAKATMPPASMQYNTSMRAYPDISAISTNFMIFLNSSISPIGGTSASTPTTAAVFSLLNQVRLDAGMPVVGFVNPMLYVNHGCC